MNRLKQHIEQCKKIFEDNKDWIEKTPLLFSNKKFQDHDPDAFSKFFSSYKKSKGTDSKTTYSERLDMFFKLTFNIFIHGDAKKFNGSDEIWKGRQEAFECFVGYLGSLAEARRYFDSVNDVSTYT